MLRGIGSRACFRTVTLSQLSHASPSPFPDPSPVREGGLAALEGGVTPASNAAGRRRRCSRLEGQMKQAGGVDAAGWRGRCSRLEERMKQAARAHETRNSGVRNEQFGRTKLPTRTDELRLALDDSPEDKPGVRGEGAEPAIVVSHDAQAFLQRTAMVARGHTLCEVVGEDELGVV